MNNNDDLLKNYIAFQKRQRELIEESKKIDHQSSIKRYESLKKHFKNKVGLLHGSLSKDEKNKILLDFLKKKLTNQIAPPSGGNGGTEAHPPPHSR